MKKYCYIGPLKLPVSDTVLGTKSNNKKSSYVEQRRHCSYKTFCERLVKDSASICAQFQ